MLVLVLVLMLVLVIEPQMSPTEMTSLPIGKENSFSYIDVDLNRTFPGYIFWCLIYV